jgi:hypothetical protein
MSHGHESDRRPSNMIHRLQSSEMLILITEFSLSITGRSSQQTRDMSNYPRILCQCVRVFSKTLTVCRATAVQEAPAFDL